MKITRCATLRAKPISWVTTILVMPSCARSFGRSVLGSPTDTPLTVIMPFWKGSSALTHLMSVDLPEPDGPHTTITSPFSTLVVQSVSTWNCPYHLETLSIEIIDALPCVKAWFRLVTFLANHGHLLLQ